MKRYGHEKGGARGQRRVRQRAREWGGVGKGGWLQPSTREAKGGRRSRPGSVTRILQREARFTHQAR